MTQPNQNQPWPDDHLADVKKRWAAGQSAGTIAKAFPGRTRLAVIGVVHRQGWQNLGRGQPADAASLKAPPVARSLHVGKVGDRFKPKPPKPGPQNKPGAAFGNMPAATAAEAAQKRIDAQKAGLATILKAVEAANDDAIPLIERRAFQCSWPVGEPARPAEQMCCGQPVLGERTKSTATYCDRHRLRAAPGGVPLARTLIRSVRRAA